MHTIHKRKLINGSFRLRFHLNSDEGLVGLGAVRIRDYFPSSLALAQQVKLFEEFFSAAYSKARSSHSEAAFMQILRHVLCPIRKAKKPLSGCLARTE